MTQHRSFAAWLRVLGSFVALVGALGLSACGGGGGGAPNNVFPLKVALASPDLFAGVPATITVTGGSAPYKVTASVPSAVQISVVSQGGVTEGSTFSLLPVNVGADTPVFLTVQDNANNSVVVNTVVHGAVAGLQVVPNTATAYSGFPLLLLVTGGVPPYKAISSNPAVLQVVTVAGNTIVLQAGNVAADTPVTITIVDAAGSVTTSTVTVRAAAMLNSLTIIPNLTECGTNAVCSGQDATATVRVLGPEGGAISGRLVRFDVVAGPYGISTAKAGQPIAPSVTVATDATGTASVIIKAQVNAPTQFAQLRVTDLAGGQQLTGNFIIQQVTDGSKILTVVAGGTGTGSAVKITGAFKGECSSGVPVDYFIYGGTPPYRITSTFPGGVILVNNTVNASGGFFEVVTNGNCLDPIVFSILDATGRQTTATLSNVEGTADRPTTPPPPALTIAPSAVTSPGKCMGKTFQFVVAGGTPDYSAILSPQPDPAAAVSVSGNVISISGLPDTAGSYQVIGFDSGDPVQTVTATLTCP